MRRIVLLERLIASAEIDINYGFEWNKGKPITLKDINNALKNDVQGTSEPFGDTWKHIVKSEKENEYHLKRIIYFIKHPKEIIDIEVDNKTLSDKYNYWIIPNANIVDGWHRLAAAVFLKLEKVKILYNGRMDVLNYLTGKRKNPPMGIL